MSVKVQPLADYVVAQAEEAQTKTASGLYLPGGTAEKPKVAKVVAVGKEVDDVAVGDRILYKNEYETTNVKVDGEEYIIIYKKNIVATVK
jgi:chaperonin GroES